MIQLNWYQIFGQSIPDGRTVTPTDDIQIWLHCGNIWDKNYTTLAQVLADTNTLVALMASDNAVDYLVRSTKWAGIQLVPDMTDNTHPSGEASASSSAGSHPPYYALDGNNNTYWFTRTDDSYIGYAFDGLTKIGFVKLHLSSANAATSNFTIKVQGSDDNATWSDVSSAKNITTYQTPATDEFVNINSNTNNRYYRLDIVGSSGYSPAIFSMQIYSENLCDSEIAMKSIGASDYASTTLLSDSTWCDAIHGSTYSSYVANVSIPTMTSDNTPEGETIHSTMNASHPAWKAFDGDDATWGGVVGNSVWSIGYKFTSRKKIYGFDFNPVMPDSANCYGHTFDFKVSNDGSTWVTIASYTYATGQKVPFTPVTINDKYQYYKFDFAGANGVNPGPYYYGFAYTVQLYGREAGGVQTWLHAAGINNKNYTTLSEVLADTSTLSTLINNHSACDYLVTCKGWATTICADSTAMTYIGLNNYCANKLLADATWRTAICNSTYFESVLNLKNPVMTSNNAPSGECISTGAAAGKANYYAFDAVNYSSWYNSTRENYIGYKFDSDKKIYLAVALAGSPAGVNYSYTTKIRSSADGVTWSDVTSARTDTIGNATVSFKYLFATPNTNRAFCLYNYNNSNASYSLGVFDLRFYGREDV